MRNTRCIHFFAHLQSGALLLLLLACLALLPITATQAANGLFPIGNLGIKSVDEAPGSDEPLPPEDAFKVTAPLYDGKTLNLRWDIAPDYYLYREKFKVRLLDTKRFQAGNLDLPEGQVKEDEFFGTVHALHASVDARLPLTPTDQLGKPLQLEVSWQGCAEKLGVCYPPQVHYFGIDLPAKADKLAAGVVLEEIDATKIEVTAEEKPATPNTAVALPAGVVPKETSRTPATSELLPSGGTSAEAATPLAEQTEAVTTPVQPASSTISAPQSEQDQIAATLGSGNTPLTLLSFLGFGLLLAFTPCVFPMIPILSGIIAGKKNITSRDAFIMSLVYVLAMALTYTLAGVLAGLFGSNLQAMFQNPWILGTFSAIFVLLALSMFGFYELQMPASLQDKLTEISNRQSGGTLVGVAIMGVLSALIVGPCVAAPLAGALIYIGQTGDALLGGAALFALSIGMGLPLLVIGTSAGKFMPRAGAWMEGVKAVFGVMLLAVAIWMLERILPTSITLLLWAALFVGSALYMGALTPLAAGGSRWHKLWKGLGIMLLIHGCLLVIGAAGGGHDMLQPLKGVFNGGGNGQQTRQQPAFKRITGLQGLEQALADAKGKPVMLDFYADWCVSCKEMEKYTFPDPAVQNALADFVLLQADVTANTQADQALMKSITIFGPPAMLFFDTKGQERKELRLVGFLPAERFAPHVLKVKNGS